MNQELTDVQAEFRKVKGTRDHIVNIHWIIEKENSRKTTTSASLTMLKPLTVWITANCGKFLEMGIPDHLTCLLRNLYEGQEETELDMEQSQTKLSDSTTKYLLNYENRIGTGGRNITKTK